MVEQTRQTIALTGATGFVGQVLTRQLLKAGHQVRALTRRPATDLNHANLIPVTGDLDSRQALDALCRSADCLIHVAGAIAARNPSDFVRTNAVGTRNLVESLERTNPTCRLVHVSSLAARSPTLSPYAASKHWSEQLVRSSHLSWLILRPPAIYGPTDPALAPLWKMLGRGWLVQAGTDTARFSLLHVDDLCAAICQLAGRPWLARQTLCLDDGRPGGYTWRDIREIAASTSGRRIRRVKLPRRLLSALAWCNEKTSRLTGHTPLLSVGKVRELTHPDWVCGDNVGSVLHHWRPQRRLSGALAELPGWNDDF